MKPFNNNIMYQEKQNKNLILFHFKSVDNNPAIFELISKDDTVTSGIVEGGFIVSVSKEKTNTIIYNSKPSNNNITTFIEYFGCKLEDDEKIVINFGNNIIVNFNKTINKGIFNINLTLEDNFAFSDKDCSLLLIFGNKDIPIYNIEESLNNTMPDYISFKYPKIKEDEHYHFYFYNNETGFGVSSCSIYYVNSDYNFIHYHGSSSDKNNILMNPYNSLEKDDSLYYLVNCYKSYKANIIYFDVIKYKQKVGILNKFFLANNYTEYKFNKLNKTATILIQVIASFTYYTKDELPTLYLGKYAINLENAYYIFTVSNGRSQK